MLEGVLLNASVPNPGRHRAGRLDNGLVIDWIGRPGPEKSGSLLKRSRDSISVDFQSVSLAKVRNMGLLTGRCESQRN